MLDGLIQSNLSPIGLDLGSSGLRMIQLKRVSGTIRVIASGHYRLPDDLPAQGHERQQVIARGIGELLEANGFRGRKTVVGLNDGMVQLKNIRMPQMAPAEQRQAVQWEAADRMQIDGEHHRIDYITAGEVRVGEELRDELLLMAVNQEALDRQVETLVTAGLNPIAMEPTPIALARCFAQTVRRESDQNLVRAMVDIGHTRSKVVIFRGQRVSFYKVMDVGGRQFTAAVAERLGLSITEAHDLRRKICRGETTENIDTADPQAVGNPERRESIHRAVFEAVRPIAGDLAKEVGLCLRYHSVTFRGARPEKVALLGGEAADPNLAKVMAEQLELEINTAAPLAGMDLSDDQIAVERRGSQPEWAVATGLAMRRFANRELALRGAA